MAITTDLTFWSIPDTLVTNIANAIKTTRGGDLMRACVVPGAIAWDGCVCGALYVAVVRWFLSETFPVNAQGPDVRTTPCEMPWLVAEIAIQIVRCAPNPQGLSIDVECTALTESAKTVASDAYWTFTTALSTLCAMKDADTIIDFSFGEQNAVGPEGGCVGSELHVFVAMPR